LIALKLMVKNHHLWLNYRENKGFGQTETKIDSSQNTL